MQEATARRPEKTEAELFLEYHLDSGEYNGRFCLGCHPGKNSDFWQIVSVDRDVSGWVDKLQPKKAYYVTGNCFQYLEKVGKTILKPEKKLRAFCNLVVDIDCHSDGQTATAGQIWAIIQEQGQDLPMPTGIVWTGRGLQLWWHVVPMSTRCNLQFETVLEWLEKRLQQILTGAGAAGWEVDMAATNNLSGWRRFPGSYNYNTGRYGSCELLHTDTYDINELKKPAIDSGLVPLKPGKYTPKLDKVAGGKQPGSETKPIKPYNGRQYSGEMVAVSSSNRLGRLMKWAQGRKWAFEGHRNAFLLVCGSLMVAQGLDNIQGRLEQLNSRLNPPKPASNVASVAKYCQLRRYRWKNKTIADRLGMTEQEAQAFGAAGEAGPVVLRRNKNQSRDAARKARKEARLERLKECKAQGMTQQQAAEAVEMSLRWVKTYWHDMDK